MRLDDMNHGARNPVFFLVSLTTFDVRLSSSQESAPGHGPDWPPHPTTLTPVHALWG